MKVNELAAALDLEIINMSGGDRTVKSGYACDLLSWVIGRAQPESAFITIMSNLNTIAVAMLADVSCVVLCENVEIDENVLKKAEEEMVNILRTSKNTFEISAMIYNKLKEQQKC
jgi:serine kinase of HPr protein (carbohydrate metabolism regulator)